MDGASLLHGPVRDADLPHRRTRLEPTDQGAPTTGGSVPDRNPIIATRIALVGPSRSPLVQPFAGGLEAHVWTLANELRDRGHDITVFAAPGSDPALGSTELEVGTGWLSMAARRDVSMQPDLVIGEHHAYLSLMLRLAREADFDLVLNHSLHYLPLAMAETLPMPTVTTLHTPPTPWLESAVRAGGASRFVAVSGYTAGAWAHVVPDARVIANGIDTRRWTFGRGGGPVVWSGRIVPEKGLHLALDAARIAGRPLDIAGPVVDRAYFETHVAPALGDQVRYVGHLDQPALARLVRGAEVALVTPDWDEPFGLVVAEALACGTPVAAFARGGVPEIVDDSCARLAPAGDVAALAKCVVDAGHLDRRAARARAERHCSLDTMVRGYEGLLDELLLRPAA